MKLGPIDNLDILTRDPDALARFYHETLELPLLLPWEPGQGWAAIDAGVTIYIFESEVGLHEPRRTPVNADNPPGLDSFALTVEDLDAAVAWLDGKGVEWAGDVIEWRHESGRWYRYRPFYDPDGNMVYVTEPHAA